MAIELVYGDEFFSKYTNNGANLMSEILRFSNYNSNKYYANREVHCINSQYRLRIIVQLVNYALRKMYNSISDFVRNVMYCSLEFFFSKYFYHESVSIVAGTRKRVLNETNKKIRKPMKRMFVLTIMIRRYGDYGTI